MYFPIKDILKKYNIRADKKLGQHFLTDINLTDKIVALAGNINNNDIICEIGPGPGILTQSLANKNAKKIIAIEYDERFVKILNEYLVPNTDGKLEVFYSDALKQEYVDIIKTHRNLDSNINIIANLPYNIATELCFNWIDHLNNNILNYNNIIVMVQKEVALKMTSLKDCKSYGKLAILLNRIFETDICFDVDPECFTPPPKVMSSVVRLTPRATKIGNLNNEEEKLLPQILNYSFAMRRKTILNNLKKFIKDSDALNLILDNSNIDPKTRPENISIEDYCQLTKQIYKYQNA